MSKYVLFQTLYFSGHDFPPTVHSVDSQVSIMNSGISTDCPQSYPLQPLCWSLLPSTNSPWLFKNLHFILLFYLNLAPVLLVLHSYLFFCYSFNIILLLKPVLFFLFLSFMMGHEFPPHHPRKKSPNFIYWPSLYSVFQDVAPWKSVSKSFPFPCFLSQLTGPLPPGM